ncbi:hypothetical protein SGM_0921 [Streptomyces griseoaurantiacus M045]|uniref:Uncharacterized protein n=1 Tax=Streptomyces griseoaurantiacus M045 TaxID=996637 RepID=F3NCQ7_9ACTN|nr:hypothetical protein SGM_0921 [Streptomyces griseoaurantiacus M045]
MPRLGRQVRAVYPAVKVVMRRVPGIFSPNGLNFVDHGLVVRPIGLPFKG